MRAGRSRLAVSAALALTVFLLPAAPAHAEGELDTGGFGTFRLDGTNGYSGWVLAGSGPGFEHGEVLVWLFRRNASVSYLAPARVTDTAIEAELGQVGRIDVEFEPAGEEGRAAPVCEPQQRVSYEKGSYVGEIELHGEEGYTDVSATRASFTLHPFIDLICGGLSIGEAFGHGIPGARLTAHARLGGRRVSLQVNQNRPDAPVKVQASIVERRQDVIVTREVRGTDPGRAFEFASDLRFAAARPDAPFSGTGTFRRGARRANRWTGSLAVDFPGNSNVSLTGARFRTKLLHAHLTEERSRARPRLSPWHSTRPLPIASAKSSLLVPR